MIKLALVLLLFSSTSALYTTSIQALSSCNSPLAQPSIYTVLGSGRNTLDGWSHIQKAKPNGEFKSLVLDDSDYQISQRNYQADESCNSEKVQSAILVMKLSDWTRQHSNGIETILDDNSIAFGDLTHVMMDIRINSSDTHIMDEKGLIDLYEPYLRPEQFKEFDQGRVNLGITLFEDGALDQSTESFNLELFVEIDQRRYSNKWLRLIMPLSEFQAYTEKDYRGTDRDLIDFEKIKVNGFRINPENSHGKQLRNLLGDDWSAEIPETFKEMSISLRRIELL